MDFKGMFKLSKSKSRMPLMLVFALLIGSVLWLYVNRYLTQSRAAQPKVNLTLAPKSGPVPADNNQSVALFIQPVEIGTKLSGFDITINASGTARLIDVQTPTSLAGNDQGLFTQVAKSVSATSTRFSYSIIRPENELPTAAKMNIVIKGTEGTGSITIDTSKSKIVGKISGYVFDFGTVDQGQYTFAPGNVTVTPSTTVTVTTAPSHTPTRTPTSGGATSTPTPIPSVSISATPTRVATVTPSTGPSVTPNSNDLNLNMKIRLQGVLRKPAAGDSIPVSVSLVNYQDGITTQTKSGTFSVDDNGIWSGSVAFTAPAATHYYLLVKGPKHLAKKICESTPRETSPGSYRCGEGKISLVKGNNALDFSNVYMLLGDLPDQDGVVDSYDISYIRNNLGNADANVTKIGDLNYDGRVDSQDYSLVIASLSVKKDEE